MQTLMGQTLWVWATATSQVSQGTCISKHFKVGSPLAPPQTPVPRPLGWTLAQGGRALCWALPWPSRDGRSVWMDLVAQGEPPDTSVVRLSEVPPKRHRRTFLPGDYNIVGHLSFL